ncbi:MAG: hypothetical protein KDC95_03460 [Planctomycetes bacterium]|nr:hypothetical protein [Planctomycetota bacterium]
MRALLRAALAAVCPAVSGRSHVRAKPRFIAAATVLCSVVPAQNLVDNDLTTWQTWTSHPGIVIITKSQDSIYWSHSIFSTVTPSVAMWTRFTIDKAGLHRLFLRGDQLGSSNSRGLSWRIHEIDIFNSRSGIVASDSWSEDPKLGTQIPEWRIDLARGTYELEVVKTMPLAGIAFLFRNAILTATELPMTHCERANVLASSDIDVRLRVTKRYDTGSSLFVAMVAAQRFDTPIQFAGFDGAGLWLRDPIFFSVSPNEFVDYTWRTSWPQSLYWQICEVNVDGPLRRAALGSQHFATLGTGR